MAYLAVDLAIIAILILFIWRSAVRGFVRTLIETVGGIIIICTAFSLSNSLAGYVYDNYMRSDIVNSIADTAKTTGLKSAEAVDEIWDSLPSVVRGAAAVGGFDKQSLSNVVGDTVNAGAEQVEQLVADNIVRPIVTGALSFIISLVLITVLMFLLHKIARWINSMFKLPLINSVNSALGGVLGAVKGALVVFALIVLISLLMRVFGNKFIFFTPEFIDKTHLFKLLYNLIPFGK